MDKQKVAQTLTKGDLIVIPYNNYLLHGIYINDEGKSSCRFYGLHSVNWRMEQIKEGKKKIYKDYIYRTGSNLIAKISPDELNEEDFKNYEEYKELLIEGGHL